MTDMQMSVKQAADLIGISVQNVHKAIKKKTIKAHRLGSFWVVDRASAEAYKRKREDKEK